MELTETERIGIIGLFISFLFVLSVSGWLYYSFYWRFESKEKKKHS